MNKRTHPFFKILPLFLILFLFACTEDNVVFEENKQFTDAQWHYEDVALFEFEVSEPESKYRLLLYLRHTNDYPYSNIHLNTRTTFPDSPAVEDVVELKLAEKTGEWMGSGSGHIIDRKIILRDDFSFSEKGLYRIDVSQHMREDPIDHIMAVGLRLEKLTKTE